MTNKKRQDALNFIEDRMIEMWKHGVLVRSSNPDTATGDYYWTLPSKAKEGSRNRPELGGYLTYEEFKSQLINHNDDSN